MSPAASLRRQLGWTQSRAARALGLCTRSLQRIERGPLAWRDAELLARVYGAALGRPVNPQFDLYERAPRLATGAAGRSPRPLVQARRTED